MQLKFMSLISLVIWLEEELKENFFIGPVFEASFRLTKDEGSLTFTNQLDK